MIYIRKVQSVIRKKVNRWSNAHFSAKLSTGLKIAKVPYQSVVAQLCSNQTQSLHKRILDSAREHKVESCSLIIQK